MQFNASVWYPTALLVKTHNLTGKKYFCKTTKLDKLDTYTGSGLAWKSHLKQFGKDISTGVVGVYYDSQRCLEAALKYSKEWNIVESDEWLNLIDENGLDGAGAGVLHPMYGKPHPDKGSKRPHTSAKLIGALNPNFGKPSKLRGRKNLGASLALKGRKRPEGGGKPSKQVLFTDKNGIEHFYNSISDAEKAQNINRSTIRKCMHGKCLSRAGDWNYADKEVAKQYLQLKVILKNKPNHNIGRKASDEAKAKMSASRSGRKQSDEERKMRSEAITKWHKSRKEQV